MQSLLALEALARLRSFAKAAGELCVTTSAITHRIKLLEEHYGVRLFVRRSGEAVLTDEGALLLDAVTDVLSRLQSTALQLTHKPKRFVRVNVVHSFASQWLIEHLDDFMAAHADIDLEIRAIQGRSLNRLMDLRSGEVDVAIRYGSASDWLGFKSVELMRVDLVPVCAPEYLQRAPRITHPSDLLTANLLHSRREPWHPWFHASGLESVGVLRGPTFNDAGLILNAALRGYGVALARSPLVSRHLAAGRLIRILDTTLPSENAYHAVYFREGVSSQEVDAFVTWLVHECAVES